METVLATAPPTVARSLKTVLDLLVASLLLLVCAPLLLLMAVAIRLTSPGPVIYRRRVIGAGGQEFDAFKLRTMVPNADQWLQDDAQLAAAFDINVKLPGDPRLTPLGRWLRRASLDELPQLINVLRGEMSLVGPRMIAPQEMHRYGDTLPKRLSVKPGITGLWQVSGRQDLTYDERIKLDLFYVDHWSLWLDLAILGRTIPAVLTMKGAV